MSVRVSSERSPSGRVVERPSGVTTDSPRAGSGRVGSGLSCASSYEALGHSSFSADVVEAAKVYSSPAEELAAYYTRIIDREYAEHLEALKAQQRAEYEYRKGELDRWRVRQIRAMCEGLEAA